MPDKEPSHSVEQEGGAEGRAIPLPPQHPTTKNAEEVGAREEAKRITRLEDRMRSAEKIMAWLTGAIALFGLCAVIVGILQWRVMSGQLEQIKGGASDTHTLAVAAKRQADKAETISSSIQSAVSALQTANSNAASSISATIDISRRDERAWVFIPGFVLNREPEGNDSISVTCTVINSGKTPAILMTHRGELAIWRPQEPPRPDWGSFKPSAPATLPPGATGYSFDVKIDNVPKVSAHSYRTKERDIYVRAFIEYEDIFKRAHWTEVCAKHTFGMPLTAFELCGRDNTTDANY